MPGDATRIAALAVAACLAAPALALAGGAPSCDPEPRTGCFEASRSALFVKRLQRPSRARLSWRWKGGEPVPAAALGDPAAGTSFALCVYAAGGAPAGAAGTDGTLQLALPARPPERWKERARGGFRFATPRPRPLPTSGPFASPDFHETVAALAWNSIKAITDLFRRRPSLRMTLALRPDGGAALRVKARGRWPGLGGLDGTSPWIAQLQASHGACFGAPGGIPYDGAPPQLAFAPPAGAGASRFDLSPAPR